MKNNVYFCSGKWPSKIVKYHFRENMLGLSYINTINLRFSRYNYVLE